jgi:hypothetical protein
VNTAIALCNIWKLIQPFKVIYEGSIPSGGQFIIFYFIQ